MSAVVEREEKPVVASQTPADLLAVAVTQGADLDKLEKLMELQERWEANEARKAYERAINAFKANPPTVMKTKRVAFSGTSYSHATLANVVDAVSKGLSQHGLSHRWEVKQNGAITVDCILSHELGHSERVSMTAPPDDSGKKNSIQQIASTVTYLERYTLMAITGLAAMDMDDDGQSFQRAAEPVDEGLLTDLRAKADEGKSALMEAWNALSEEKRRSLGGYLGELKNRAKEAPNG